MLPTTNQILETFQFLDNWEDRYSYVIDLGKKLPPFPEAEKTEGNLVRGCTSQVWMITQNTPSSDVSFLADSDALIVRGLIGILMAVYNGQSKDVVRNFDIDGFFAQLGLSDHLSPNRRNGFFAMVNRIKAMAN